MNARSGESVVVDIIPNCDVCTMAGEYDIPAYADAYVPAFNTWGNVCRRHFDENKCKLGTGSGQVLVCVDDTEMGAHLTTIIENEHVAKRINEVMAGTGAKVIDHRDYDEGIKIGINCGDATEIAEISEVDPDLLGLTDGMYLEVVNGECLRLLK